MECGSRIRVESNWLGFGFAFNSGVDNFESYTPMYTESETIISILFEDGEFGELERSDVELYI
jgi:hypothetical protein